MSRSIPAAFALLCAMSTPAFAQNNVPAPQTQTTAGDEDPTDDDALVVTGTARELPLPEMDNIVTRQMRAECLAREQCAVRAQGAGDPMRPELDAPEERCRARR